MARRKLVTALLLGAGSWAGSTLYRRRTAQRRRRVELYYEDGAMVTLAEGEPAAEPLLALAREILET